MSETARSLVEEWDSWQKAGGPSGVLDIWEWAPRAVEELRRHSQPSSLRERLSIAEEAARGTRTLGTSRRQRGAEPRAVPPEPR